MSATPITPAVIAVGQRMVGATQPAYFIAEAGVNHGGDVDAARRMIDAAADAGADAVKFQMFRADDLVTRSAGTAAYQHAATGADTQHALLRELELNDADFAVLREHCRARDVAFLATPFGPRELRALLAWDAPAIKLASTDLNNQPLLHAAAASGRPLLLSTGAAHRDEIDHAVEVCRAASPTGSLILLHCVSSYPAPWEKANLRRITALARRYRLPVGYSDHTADVATGALAVAAGACVIEKHFTLDRALPGPDHALSLEPDALTEFISRIRDTECALGDGALDAGELEDDVRRHARKSIVTTRAVHAGETLTDADLSAKRPGDGIAPTEWAQVVGKRVRRAIPADTQITWDMLAPND
jgi:N,N'-diacetyllegionaminate synthase